MAQEQETTRDIHEAVDFNDYTLVLEILENDPSCVNYWDLAFKTPLHVASEKYHNNSQMMRILISHGAEVNIQTGYAERPTPLHHATAEDYGDQVEMLLENGADPNFRDCYGRTPLHNAVEMSNMTEYDTVYQLVSNGADPNVCDNERQMPLDIAIESAHMGILRILITHGAKCNNIYEHLLKLCLHEKDINNYTDESDDESSEEYDWDERKKLSLLLKNASNIDINGQFSPKTLMHFISSRQHDNDKKNKCLIFKWLQEQGIEFEDGNGNSDLHIAVLAENEEEVEALLKKGANVNDKNFDGNTPLHLLLKNKTDCFERHHKIAELLINYGTDLSETNAYGDELFSTAISNKKIDVVNLMLAKITGIDKAVLQNNDSTICSFDFGHNVHSLNALNAAIFLNYEQVVERLINIDYCDEEIKNSSQGANKALSLAAYNKSYSIVKMLLEAGFQSYCHFVVDVPTLCRRKFDEVDYLIACLFWEYKDYSCVNAVLGALDRFILNDVSNTFMYLMIFNYTIDVHTDQVNTDLIPVKRVFTINENLSKICSLCNKKLNEMKKVKLGDLSIYAILTMELDTIENLLKNIHYFQVCSEYYSYLEEKKELEYCDYTILTRLKLAIEKWKVINGAIDFLNKVFQSKLRQTTFNTLPNEVMDKIMRDLPWKDIKKISLTTYQ